MYRGHHEGRSSSSKHGHSSRERRSRTPPPLSYSGGLSASQKRIMEMEEKIRRLDKSLEATTQRIQSYQEREVRQSREHSETKSGSISKPRRRSRSRERSRSPYRLLTTERYDARSPPRKVPSRPDDSFDQFRRINEFRMQYEASTSSQKSYEPLPVYPTEPEPQRYSFPVFWNQGQNEIRVDPVPVYPGCFGDVEEEEEEKERSMRALEEQRQAYEEEKQMEILAREAARIKKQHLTDIQNREKEEQRKKEDAEKKRKLAEEESRRKEREKKNKVEPKKPEPTKKPSSSSSTSLLTERILSFFKELNVALGPIVYESSSKKTGKGYDDWTTICHITNIPKELISATSIGKSSKESSRNHSVERFFDKLVTFGILAKNVRDDFAKYKTLPVFLAGIMNDFFNDIAIYGTQISVTGDRDMTKKFAAFAKEKSQEFWNRQESVVVAFLKCQTAALSSSSSSSSSRKTEESSRKSSRESDDRRAKERRDRERDRERREKEKEKDRARDKSRRRAAENAKEYVAPPVPIVYPTVVAPTPTQQTYMSTYPPGMGPAMNYLQTYHGAPTPIPTAQFNPMGPPPPIGQFASPMVASQQFQPTPFAPRPDFPVQCFSNGASVKPQPLMGPTRTNGVQQEESGDLFDEVFK